MYYQKGPCDKSTVISFNLKLIEKRTTINPLTNALVVFVPYGTMLPFVLPVPV